MAATLLAACASAPPKVAVTEAEIEAREARLARFDRWRAQGSLLLDSESEGVFNVSFAWDANPDNFNIRLFGPLGKQAYSVSQDRYGATLQRETDPPVYGSSADLLLAEAAGVLIPIEQLQQWVVGLPGGDETQISRDTKGRLRSLDVAAEDGSNWQLAFNSYRVVNALDLPRSISVSGDGVEIALTIRKWSLPSAPADDSRLQIPGLDG